MAAARSGHNRHGLDHVVSRECAGSFDDVRRYAAYTRLDNNSNRFRKRVRQHPEPRDLRCRIETRQSGRGRPVTGPQSGCGRMKIGGFVVAAPGTAHKTAAPRAAGAQFSMIDAGSAQADCIQVDWGRDWWSAQQLSGDLAGTRDCVSRTGRSAPSAVAGAGPDVNKRSDDTGLDRNRTYRPVTSPSYRENPIGRPSIVALSTSHARSRFRRTYCMMPPLR